MQLAAANGWSSGTTASLAIVVQPRAGEGGCAGAGGGAGPGAGVDVVALNVGDSKVIACTPSSPGVPGGCPELGNQSTQPPLSWEREQRRRVRRQQQRAKGGGLEKGEAQWCTHELTQDHRPGRRSERERIEALGGTVLEAGGLPRLMGELAVSRALGDARFRPWLTPEPETGPWLLFSGPPSQPLPADSRPAGTHGRPGSVADPVQEVAGQALEQRGVDRSLLVVATDGVFERMSPREVCAVAARALTEAKPGGSGDDRLCGAPREVAIALPGTQGEGGSAGLLEAGSRDTQERERNDLMQGDGGSSVNGSSVEAHVAAALCRCAVHRGSLDNVAAVVATIPCAELHEGSAGAPGPGQEDGSAQNGRSEVDGSAHMHPPPRPIHEPEGRITREEAHPLIPAAESERRIAKREDAFPLIPAAAAAPARALAHVYHQYLICPWHAHSTGARAQLPGSHAQCPSDNAALPGVEALEVCPQHRQGQSAPPSPWQCSADGLQAQVGPETQSLALARGGAPGAHPGSTLAVPSGLPAFLELVTSVPLAPGTQEQHSTSEEWGDSPGRLGMGAGGKEEGEGSGQYAFAQHR